MSGIILITFAGILQFKIHEILGIDGSNPIVKPTGFWGFNYLDKIFEERKELIEDSIAFSKIRLYKIIIWTIYFCLFSGIGMFILNIIQNQK